MAYPPWLYGSPMMSSWTGSFDPFSSILGGGSPFANGFSPLAGGMFSGSPMLGSSPLAGLLNNAMYGGGGILGASDPDDDLEELYKAYQFGLISPLQFAIYAGQLGGGGVGGGLGLGGLMGGRRRGGMFGGPRLNGMARQRLLDWSGP